MVVRVGIGAQIRDHGGTVAETHTEYPGCRAVRGEAVNRAVGQIIQPVSVPDHGIGRIVADQERKDAAEAGVCFDQIAVPVMDILKKDVRGGIFTAPLSGVAVFFHLLPRIGVDLLHGGKVV